MYKIIIFLFSSLFLIESSLFAMEKNRKYKRVNSEYNTKLKKYSIDLDKEKLRSYILNYSLEEAGFNPGKKMRKSYSSNKIKAKKIARKSILKETLDTAVAESGNIDEVNEEIKTESYWFGKVEGLKNCRAYYIYNINKSDFNKKERKEINKRIKTVKTFLTENFSENETLKELSLNRRLTIIPI